jgi:hypothetical protein
MPVSLGIRRVRIVWGGVHKIKLGLVKTFFRLVQKLG